MVPHLFLLSQLPASKVAKTTEALRTLPHDQVRLLRAGLHALVEVDSSEDPARVADAVSAVLAPLKLDVEALSCGKEHFYDHTLIVGKVDPVSFTELLASKFYRDELTVTSLDPGGEKWLVSMPLLPFGTFATIKQLARPLKVRAVHFKAP